MFLNEVRLNSRLYLSFQIILFLFWPLGSFLISLFFIRNQISQLFFVLFSALAGYCLIYPENFDISRHLIQFEVLASLTFTDIFNPFYFVQNRVVDLYSLVLFYIVSLFTNDSQILTCLVYVVYSFFFIKLVKLLCNYLPTKVNIAIQIFFLGIVFTFPIEHIQVIRFSTGFIYFIYFLLKTFLGSRKALFYLLLSPLIHFSMILPCLVYLLYKYLKLKEVTCWIIVVVSLFCSELMTFFASGIVNLSTDNIYKAVFLSYTANKEDYQNGFDAYNWYIQYKDLFVFIILSFLVVVVQKTTKSDLLQDHFFRFLLLLFAFVNISSFDPILLSRVRIIFIMLCYIYLFFVSIYNKSYSLMLCGGMAAFTLLWQIIINLRQAMEVIPIAFLYSNLYSLMNI